jgi:hypothetical protein
MAFNGDDFAAIVNDHILAGRRWRACAVGTGRA